MRRTSPTTTGQDRDRAQLVRVDVVHAAAAGLDQEPRDLRAGPVVRARALLVGERFEIRVEAAARRALEHSLEVALDLGRAHPRLQSAHHLQPPVGRLAQPRLDRRVGPVLSCGSRESGSDMSGGLATGCCTPLNVGGDHADDGDRHVVDLDGLADDGRIGAEPRVPVLRADDRNRRCGGNVVFRQDRPADPRRDAEHLEVVAGRDERLGDLRLPIDDDVHAAERRAGHQVRHRLVVGDELLIHRVGERRAHVLAIGRLVQEAVAARARDHVVAPGVAEANELLGLLDGQGGQQPGVHGAENRGVGADAERERQHDDGRPASGLPEQADGVTQILEHQSSDVTTGRAGPILLLDGVDPWPVGRGRNVYHADTNTRLTEKLRPALRGRYRHTASSSPTADTI